jgi:hypothetical protein
MNKEKQKEGNDAPKIENGNNFYTKATVISVNNGIYTVRFEDGTTQQATYDELKIYFPCNCNVDQYISSSVGNEICGIPTQLLLES